MCKIRINQCILVLNEQTINLEICFLCPLRFDGYNPQNQPAYVPGIVYPSDHLPMNMTISNKHLVLVSLFKSYQLLVLQCTIVAFNCFQNEYYSFPSHVFSMWLFSRFQLFIFYVFITKFFVCIEGGEQGCANPPIRGIFRPNPSIRLNFCSNPNPCYLKIFRGIQKVALQHEKMNYLIQLFCNRNRCGTSCLKRFRYSFKTLSIRTELIMFLPTIQI